MPRAFDLIIIGSGSGNTIVDDEFRGTRTAIVDSGTFGGTCLNVGCIPTKMYVYPADLARRTVRMRRRSASTRPRRASTGRHPRPDLRPDRPDLRRRSRLPARRIRTSRCSSRTPGSSTTHTLALGDRRDDHRRPDRDRRRLARRRPGDRRARRGAVPHLRHGDAHRRCRGGWRSSAAGTSRPSSPTSSPPSAREVTVVCGRDQLLAPPRRRGRRARVHRADRASGWTSGSARRRPGRPDRRRRDLGRDRRIRRRRRSRPTSLLVATGRVPNGDRLDLGAAGVEVDDDGFGRRRRVPAHHRPTASGRSATSARTTSSSTSRTTRRGSSRTTWRTRAT